MSRNSYDMKHEVVTCGKIGRLQTIGRFDVLPGDVWQGESRAYVRLSQLRRPMINDIQFDVHAFFVPHIYIYDQAYKTWIINGLTGTTVLPMDTVVSGNSPHEISCVLGTSEDQAQARHVLMGYNMIWNWYYRNQLTASERSYADFKTQIKDKQNRNYGFQINHLKSLMTTMLPSRMSPDEVSYTVGSNKKLNMYEMAEDRAQTRTVAIRTYKATDRFDQIFRERFGTSVSDDIVKKPHFLGSSRGKVSGVDVDGTSGDQLGQTVGKGVLQLKFNLRKKFFKEHGTIWLLCVARTKPLYKHFKSYNDTQSQTYDRVAGDDATSMYEPILVKRRDVDLNTSSNNTLGYMPRNQQFRTMEGYVHPGFYEQDKGYVFNQMQTDAASASLIRPEDYDESFLNHDLLGHWRASVMNRFTVQRNISGPEVSLATNKSGGIY